MFDLDDATNAAMQCLEWCSLNPEHYENSDAPECLDALGYDWTDDAIARMQADLSGFASLASDDIDVESSEQVGHDFVLTRNGHGAGFWDRGLGDAGERLTHWAKTFSETDAWPDHATKTIDWE